MKCGEEKNGGRKEGEELTHFNTRDSHRPEINLYMRQVA